MSDDRLSFKQMCAWVELADGQLVELEEQRKQLASATAELKDLRDSVARELDG